MKFGLFYFANYDGEDDRRNKYRLILDTARWADAHGFERLWAPERHFHRFGGLSPNPSVLAAAIAAVTSRIQICAGSVVLPLHDPIRVAEEWAVVDNISNGRIGLGVACGWVPNDFVISDRQGDFADRHRVFETRIGQLRSLWRGDPYDATNPQGTRISLQTLPRPIQRELPLWITAAANPATFRYAGAIGANLLTHLLGQTVETLAEKVEAYRQAWAAAGHAGRGTVTVMLHTFVGDSDDAVHDLTREPMKRYLGSSLTLAAAHLASVPFLRAVDRFDPSLLTPELTDQMLEFSFERYFCTASLLGSAEKCLAVTERFRQIGVDELACLIDFGVAEDRVVAALERLDAVRRAASAGRPDGDGPRPVFPATVPAAPSRSRTPSGAPLP
jgi:natural product biosynthesis luciferase-like monooxygenase protein